MFKSVVIFTFLFLVSVKSEYPCSDNDIKVMEDCYNNTLFSINGFTSDSSKFREEMNKIFEDSEKLKNMCHAKDLLYQCVNENDTTIISRCFNVPDAQRFSFGGDDENKGRRYITLLFQLGYICYPKNSWALERSKSVADALDFCEYMRPTKESQLDLYVYYCIRLVALYYVDSQYNYDDPIGCYASKFATYQSCYDVPDHDYYCNSLSSTNNGIDTMCSTDNTTTTAAPSTTTTTTTTKIIPSQPPCNSVSLLNNAAIIYLLLAFATFCVFL